MYLGGDWQRPPMPAQFSLRVAVLGGIALVMFAIIFLRLWYLEILSGDRYLAEAQNNQVREFTVQAPRGEITDREGEVLVDNRTALELQVKTTELPRTSKNRQELFKRLGEAVGMSAEQIRKQIRVQTKDLPSSPVTLKRDVPYELVYFLRENQARFPGVSVERVYVRDYPQGTLAAHMLGYVREVDEEELKDPRYESLEPADMVGKEGVEYTYDDLLRGINGATRVQVDASGRPTGGQLSVREPRTGNNLALTIDADVQAVGERALSSIGHPGGFVAMNVNSGEMLAMGSNPTYDPSIFAKPVVPQATYEQLTSDATSAPITNRAIQGLYPTGSTFKPITAVAALSTGEFTPETVINDPGEFEIGGITFKNAGDAAFGPIQLQPALQFSSDVFFYNLGADLNEEDPDGGPLQAWAKQLGIGSPTGIDVLGEGAGLLPTPGWRNENFERNTAPDSPGGQDVVVEEGELTDRPWAVGDNVNLAVGQGDLQADPLQMAVAYAAIANGGSVVRPHVGLRVEDPAGRAIQEIDPAPRRQLQIEPTWRQAIMEGLHDAAMAPGGTSYPVFGGFPVEIAGKTGTAERPPHGDQSWYVALAPYPDPQYVVAVTAEEGGFGVDTAAPVTRQILTELLNVKESKIKDVSGEAAVAE
ncbi:MAG TPA: penicillin-binding protein 2 [Solirubrobacterales bacterium]|jgi:penicillin-binding protein 2|nr:penicillin-binding protein 2 [Solirubrobacterales bacterium]